MSTKLRNMFYWTNDLHLTRFVGGIPKFFFLLSVRRLKKHPHVGLPTVEKGAIEFDFFSWALVISPREAPVLPSSFFGPSFLWNLWKWREYLSGPRCNFSKRMNSNLSQLIVRGFGLNPTPCDAPSSGSLMALMDLSVAHDISQGFPDSGKEIKKLPSGPTHDKIKRHSVVLYSTM